jgi:hypothetical protein
MTLTIVRMIGPISTGIPCRTLSTLKRLRFPCWHAWEGKGRRADPALVVLDTQSVRAAASVPAAQNRRSGHCRFRIELPPAPTSRRRPAGNRETLKEKVRP